MFVWFFFHPPPPPLRSAPLAAPPSTRPRSPPSACCPLISLPGASVCLTSATSCSSSGNYLAALRCLLIFVSTCRNICFRRVICQRERATLFGWRVLSTFTHAHKALLSPLHPHPPERLFALFWQGGENKSRTQPLLELFTVDLLKSVKVK